MVKKINHLLPRSLSPACIQRGITSNDPYVFNFIFAQEPKKNFKKCAFGSFVLWSTEQSSSRMCFPAVLTHDGKASSSSQACPKNQSLLQEQPLISPSPSQCSLHSLSPFLCHSISESLNYFMEKEEISKKGSESIFPHARIVITWL